MVRLAPRLFAVLFLVVALVAIPTGAPAQQPDGGTKYALVVGIDAYEDAKRLPRLSYAEADAKALAQVLEDQKVEVTLLLGKAASKKGIEAAFDAILARGTARDTLLVAFAGHGQQFRPAGEMEDVPFLCAADCTATRADTQVRLNALLAKAGDAKVGKALFLIDACRTDPGAQSGVTGNAVSVKAQTEVLFAAANGQKAREHADAGGKGSGHGLFMSEVIAALRGEAKNRRGEVTWNGLVAHITGEVTAKSKELFPALEDSQHQTPHKLGSLAGEVVLARTKDAPVAPPMPKTTDTAKGAPKAGEEREFEIADGVKMTFCWIPPGDCQLGSPKAERDAVMKIQKTTEDESRWLKSLKLEAEEIRGKHVERKGFWLGKYPVTQAEWVAVMGTTPFGFHKDGKREKFVKQVAGMDTSRFPAESMEWHDVQEFLGKVNGRAGVPATFGKGAKLVLPHENRWEYACRGGKGNKLMFYWGDSLNGDKANCDGNSPFGTTEKGEFLERPTAVGAYAAKAPHPWGLCDMSGNVLQWCENMYSSDSELYVCRGGSWVHGGDGCRAASRDGVPSALSGLFLGFRVCVVMD